MINKFPIVIIGSGPRCGSTAYAQLLQQTYNIPGFHEPWIHRIFTKKKANDVTLKIDPKFYQRQFFNYIKCRSNTNRYVVKFFVTDIEHRSPYHHEIKNGYKILLQRRNLVDQIASWYIANARYKHTTFKHEVEDNYIVNINPKEISFLIYVLTRSNFLIENCNIFDEKVFYEDIDFSNLESTITKTKLPENMEELRNEIKKQFDDKIPFHWKESMTKEENDFITEIDPSLVWR